MSVCVRLSEICRFWADRVHTSGQDLEKTRLFKDPEQIGHFVAHYHSFKYHLHPPAPITEISNLNPKP